jgi:hypothetical protein
MHSLIFPEIFDGHVMGFFTDRTLGTSVESITHRRVYFPRQTHSDTVEIIDRNLEEREADAVITMRRDIILGVRTADCVPILLYDKKMLIIAAVHAGWRGTARGILKKTVARMQEVFLTRPEDILLAIGPSIGECCYEVEDHVAEAVSIGTGPGEYVSPRAAGRPHLDLQEANRVQALGLGIPEHQISVVDRCTCCSNMFHSYRRDPSETGRQGGFIGFP